MPSYYSQADILRWAIIENGWGSNPNNLPLGIWPVYAKGEPPSPDSVVTIFDTQGKVDARLMVGGYVIEHPGIQIRVRTPDLVLGRSYLTQLKIYLSEQLYQYTVSIGTGTSVNQYLIQACTNFGNILELGKEVPHSRRSVFTLNCMMSYQDVTLPN